MKHITALSALVFALWTAPTAIPASPDWARTARLAGSETLGTWLSDAQIDAALAEHRDQNISVLLIWADEEAAYQLTPQDFAYLKKVVAKAHAFSPPMRIILYLAPLEQISVDVDMNKDGKVDPGKHSVYSDHPSWVQTGMDGRPAVFYGSFEFWLGPHDEDAWVCPNNPDWRALEIAAFQKLGATGIDGVWWDRPEFMSDLGMAKWQWQWACHCASCRSLFQSQKGEPIPTTIDFTNETWRDWIEWRYRKMGEFISACRDAARQKNPGFVLFNEFWDRTDWYGTEAGFSDLRARAYHDGIAHEWGVRDPPNKYKYFDWKSDLVTYRAFRGFDRDHPSWVLAYSQSIEDAKTLVSGQLQMGCNFYESRYYEMVPSIDKAFRRQLFGWIRDNQEIYYGAGLLPFANVALYYSEPSINWIDAPSRGNDDVYEEFQGIGILLGEMHTPYVVLGPDRLSEIGRYDAVVLPNAAAMTDAEAAAFTAYVQDGGRLVSTAETSLYDGSGSRRGDYALSDVFGTHSPASGVKVNRYGAGVSVFAPRRFGQDYFAAVKPGSPNTLLAREKQIRQQFAGAIWSPAAAPRILTLAGHEWLAIDLYYNSSKMIIRVTNYRNIRGPAEKPTPDSGITLDVRLPAGFTPGAATIRELLGTSKPISVSTPQAGIARITFSVQNHVAIVIDAAAR